MTTYMWMFCEGFYLHKLIAASFAEQKSLRMFYFIGWGEQTIKDSYSLIFLNAMNVYRLSTEAPYYPSNNPIAAAIFIRVVTRHGEVTMRYWMKTLTAPPGGKQ
ncbi:hypothetical protein AVEN_264500-1 [Araneus ventricosus]|uniref:Uncharacterized protein n=1 Tax=Araneus ventricosus TaxID=182803 RepID=A0A4Y2QS69_ARAVE|nr:hypothetical protein AVEN_264500-1 [Araneus ventricosus]